MERAESIYVSAAFKHADKEHREETRIIKELLRQDGRTVIDFVDKPLVKPGEVYLGNGVPRGNMTLAVLGCASDGRGFEIGMSLFRFMRPVLAVVREEHQDEVSRLIVDIGSEIQDWLFQFYVYKTPAQLVEEILPKFEATAGLSRSPFDFWHTRVIGQGDSPFREALKART